MDITTIRQTAAVLAQLSQDCRIMLAHLPQLSHQPQAATLNLLAAALDALSEKAAIIRDLTDTPEI